MRRERPWRAVAYLDLGPSFGRITVGRTARATEESVRRWAEQVDPSYRVDVWCVEPIPEVEALVSAAITPPPSVPSEP